MVFGDRGRVAVADPAGDRLSVLSLDEVCALPLEDDSAAVSAAFTGDDELLAVVDGALQRVDLRRGELIATARPHSAQTLAVGAGPLGETTLGAELDGTYTLRTSGAVVALPGRPPPSPQLRATRCGWLVELWSGLALVGATGAIVQLRLPPLRDGGRPILGGRRVVAAGDRVVLACQPPLAPYVYRLRDLTFEARLEPEAERDQPA